MFRRLLITALSAAVFGCALVSCGDGAVGSGEPLRWKTAVDVPVNFSLPVDFEPLFPGCKNLDSTVLAKVFKIKCDSISPAQQTIVDSLLDIMVDKLPDTTCFRKGLGTGTVPTTSDVMDILRKLDKPEIRYSVEIKKNSSATFTVYGMFFPTNDSLGKVSDTAFYDVVIHDSTKGKRVNVLDSSGLIVGGKDMKCYPRVCNTLTNTNPILDSLVIGRGQTKKAFSWRWLVMLEKSEYENLRKSTVKKDTVNIRLRINFSGVNSVDSLVKMFK